jgi:hypothetical protein
MSALPLTDWIPCTTPPIRDGWYDVERRSFDKVVYHAERVRYAGGWDRDSSITGMPVWVSQDYWRGVAGDQDAITK